MSVKKAYRTELDNRSLNDLKEPSFYKVILCNDNYTTMEFVVSIIIEVFQKDHIEATNLMLDIHKKGNAVVGIYPYDIARTKVEMVHKRARQEEYPLKCLYEQE